MLYKVSEKVLNIFEKLLFKNQSQNWIFPFLQMMKFEQHSCEIVKIKSPTVFVIRDTSKGQNQSVKIQTIKTFLIELQRDHQKVEQKSLSIDKQTQNHQGLSFYHLLPQLMIKKDTLLTYQIIEQKIGKFISPNQQVKKAYLYLNGTNILNLYKYTDEISLACEMKELQVGEIIQCYVMKVECLKLILLNLQNLKQITFYFSEFKLVKPNNLHPKDSWEAAQKYFIEELQGDFVQVKINGTQVYRQEINVYGQILRVKDGEDIKQLIISDGYVELSKNANKYLSEQTIQKFHKMADYAKDCYKGIWGLKQNKQSKRSTNQAEEAKYRKWDSLLNDKNSPVIKNIQEQSKQILVELKKINPSNVDFCKGKTLLGVIQLLFQKVNDKKNLKNLHQAVKILSQIFLQIQITIIYNHTNVEFLKFYSKCLTFCIFYLEKTNQFVDHKAKEVFPSSSQFEKILKTTFKTCYIGNETFNERFFGKKKETNYENFSFDSAYLNGGISSYSEQSDYDETQSSKYQNKQNKKIASAHTKLRINSTYLISLIFKFYPSIVETNWQICARSNILGNEFFEHLRKQKISADSTNMSEGEKKELSCLLKSNFGDPSLLLLTIFQRNTKVRTNALNCIYNMIINFQGKKMINTTESVYIQKLLKSTKSSYIPKSYIIFSGLKNILYFLLFTLKYEKNLEIIEITFKTLCQLCNQCSLLDKLEFQDGMKLLMENYIEPVLSFPWNIPQLQQLKIVCISFLSVLVSTQKRWDQIENNYLLTREDSNINLKLLENLQKHDSKNNQNNKIFEEIIKYFSKLPKQYFQTIFFNLKTNCSIWKYLSDKSLQKVDILFSNFVAEVFKFNFDQIKIQQENQKFEKNPDERRRVKQKNENLNKNQILLPFLEKFIPVYATLVSNQNYINLINILTNIEHSQWSKKQQKYFELKNCKQFIYHLFQGLTGAKISKRSGNLNFPSIKDLQQNSLVRVNLIKLIGYLSFCQEFQREEIILPSVQILIKFSKKYKSPNTVIKITWAISNWAKVDRFISSIKKQTIQNCINYLIQQSSSDKQKIASNSTRGIGFFMSKKQSTNQLLQLHDKCKQSIINNLDHSIIKVRTNSTKSLRSMINQFKPEQIQKIRLQLQQNILKNNFHLQSQTLILIKEMGTPIEKKRLVSLYITILKNLLNQSQLQYEFSEIKTIKHLRKIVLEEVIEHISQLKLTDSVDVFITIYAYLVDCYNQLKDKNQQNKILQKGEQKGEQVEKLIFNIKNKITYNQQNIITTQTTLKGFKFNAKKSDLSLIEKIKTSAKNRKNHSLCQQWEQLETIHIQADQVTVGNLYI